MSITRNNAKKNRLGRTERCHENYFEICSSGSDAFLLFVPYTIQPDKNNVKGFFM